MTRINDYDDSMALAVGQAIGIDFSKVDLEEFKMGLSVELEHGLKDLETNVTDNDIYLTAKIAWAHLKEMPDYYTRLVKMEAEAEKSGPKLHRAG